MYGGGFTQPDAPYPPGGAPYPPQGPDGQPLPYGVQPPSAPHPGPGGFGAQGEGPYPPPNEGGTPLYPQLDSGMPQPPAPSGIYGEPSGQPGNAGFGQGGYPPQPPNPSQGYPPPGGFDVQQGGYPQPNSAPGYPAQTASGFGVPQQGFPASYPGAAPLPNAPGGMGKKISINMQCSNLASKDFFSKSDPMCVMYVRQGGTWVEQGRTEVIQNNHFPIWRKKFTLDFVPGTNQQVKFEVYDADDSSARKLRDQDFLGMSSTTLDEIVVAHGKHFQGPLRDGPSKQKNAQIKVDVEMLSTVNIHLAGQNLKDLDTFSKSDPFFVIKKKTPYGQMETVYTSERIDNNLNPQWKPFSLLDDRLCNGDYNLPLQIAVYDWDSGNNHDLIGQCDASLTAMKSQFERGGQLQLVNPRKRGKTMGMILIKSLQII